MRILSQEHLDELLLRINDSSDKVYHLNRLLHLTIKHNNIDHISQLIKAGANADVELTDGPYRCYTFIFAAAAEGHTAVVELLIAKGINADAAELTSGVYKGYTPIYAAASNGHTAVVDLLIAKGINANAVLINGPYKGYTPIYAAASNGHTAVVKLLIANGVNANAVLTDGSCQGWTPICAAAVKGHTAVVELLIANGINANAVITDSYYDKGRTPIFAAAAKGHTAVVKTLVLAGAYTDALSFYNDEIQLALNLAKLVTHLVNSKAVTTININPITLIEQKEFISKLFFNSLVREGIPDDEFENSYKIYAKKIAEKYSAILPTEFITMFDNCIANGKLSSNDSSIAKFYGIDFEQNIAEIEGELLAIFEGIEHDKFVAMRMTQVMRVYNAGTNQMAKEFNAKVVPSFKEFTISESQTDEEPSSIELLIRKHPEFNTPGEVVKYYLNKEYLNGISELHYGMQRDPLIRNVFNRMNAQILPKQFKQMVEAILAKHEEICQDHHIQNLLVLEDKWNELQHSSVLEIKTLKAELLVVKQQNEQLSIDNMLFNTRLTSLENFVKILLSKQELSSSTAQLPDMMSEYSSSIDVDVQLLAQNVY